MPKGRRRPRTHPRREDEDAFFPLVPRVDQSIVSIDAALRLSPERLAELLALHDAPCEPWMFALEERIGGMHFGEAYAAVYLGFRFSFSAYLQTGTASPLPRTRSRQTLLRVGIEGDTHYFVTFEGEAWAQDGIADRWPHREAASFDELSANLWWPAETRASP